MKRKGKKEDDIETQSNTTLNVKIRKHSVGTSKKS